MGFMSFLEHLFFEDNDNNVELNTKSISFDRKTLDELWATRLALNITAERYGALLSKCEFKTYINGKVTRGDNWYTLNVRPNPNQSAAEFKKQIARKLIMSPTHDVLIVCLDKVGTRRQCMYVAESFKRSELQMFESSFTDVTISTHSDETYQLRGIFSGDKAIYFKLTNKELDVIFSAMRAQFARLAYNAEKAGTYRQKYVLSVDQTAEAQQGFEENMQTLLDEQFNAFINGDNAVIPLYAGMKLDQTSAGADLGQNASIANKSVNAQVDEALIKIGLAFNIPESITMGRYEADDLDQMLVWCIDPMAQLITDAFNSRWYGERAVIGGTYCRLDTEGCRHFDLVTIAQLSNNAISSGVYSINNIREKAHEEPIDPAIGDVHWITRNYAVTGEYMNDPENSATYTEDKRKEKSK